MKRSRIQPGDGDPRHGTVNGYVNLGCRGACCREPWAIHNREWRNADPARILAHRESTKASRTRNRAVRGGSIGADKEAPRTALTAGGQASPRLPRDQRMTKPTPPTWAVPE